MILLWKHGFLRVTVKVLFLTAQAAHDDRGVATQRAMTLDYSWKTVLAKAQVEVSTYLMPHIVTGEGNIGFHCEWDNLNRTTTNVHGNTIIFIINSSGGIMLGNMLPIVQAIDTNKLRWCGLITRREEESMLRVMMQLKANGKRSRGDQDQGG